MSEQLITCPNCQHKFELTDALINGIKENLEKDLNQEFQNRELKLIEKQHELSKIEKQLNTDKKSLDDQVSELVQKELKSQSQQIEQKKDEEYRVKIEAIENELAEKSNKINENKKIELALRKKTRDLEEQRDSMELEIERKLSEERKTLISQAQKQAEDKQKLKLREKETLIESLQSKIDELQRNIEQGSQERQGEALEEELIELLQRKFPFDEFEEVKRGAKGGDIIHKVRNNNGKQCGIILWESKNSKNYSNSWIPKLKKDQQEAKADIAILLTMTLPPEIDNFDFCEDVWISDMYSALNLCLALRHTLIAVEREKLVSTSKENMKDLVYDYITGNEFIQRLKMIIGSYSQMKSELESEKRSFERIWNKREKQIEVVVSNIAGMFGEIEGIVGNEKTLPDIDQLLLE